MIEHNAFTDIRPADNSTNQPGVASQLRYQFLPEKFVPFLSVEWIGLQKFGFVLQRMKISVGLLSSRGDFGKCGRQVRIRGHGLAGEEVIWTGKAHHSSSPIRGYGWRGTKLPAAAGKDRFLKTFLDKLKTFGDPVFVPAFTVFAELLQCCGS